MCAWLPRGRARSRLPRVTPTGELDAAALRRECEPSGLGFESTEAVEPLQGQVGQERAREAIAFGLGIETAGYNLFVSGPVGTGRRTILEASLREFAQHRASPGDWVYLHNFQDPRQPIAVALPSGVGRRFQSEMRRFLDDARRELVAAFESENYAQRQREITEPLEHEQEHTFNKLREQALAGSVALELTPTGPVTVPLRGGRPMSPADFAQLPDPVRARYQSTIEGLAAPMQTFLSRWRALQREGRDRLRALEREVALFAIGHLIDELKERHRDSPQLLNWLSLVAEDMTENLWQFQGAGAAAPGGDASSSVTAALAESVEPPLARYEVNVFVSSESGDGAPVVVETNPTYPNLFGRIEHHGVLGGGFATDHRMLRAGSLHRANGGYLMLPAAEVLSQPLVWLKLKDVLRSGAVRLENPAEQYALIPTTTLTPEPIELDLKVVLVGSPPLYELAYAVDEDVRKLFRVKVEFDWRTRWDEAGELTYARFVSSQVRSAGLRHFDAPGVAAVIEYGARRAESRDWLSTEFVEVAGLVAEASYLATCDGSEVVSAAHVARAVEQKIGRSNLVEQRLLEMVEEGTLLLDLDGERVGQINGLSVLQLGDYAFGRPVRITASVGPGRGALLSIERETELSGHIHDKGFLTLSGYLRERYGAERRIAIGATLTFEQSYEHIDGDSAASAELYALLSELAGAPARQDIAVTGSVDQHGVVQAIGGVNEKIEGFYRTCSLRGLTGSQGVMIPQSNCQNLMLSAEVVEAVHQGRFHVWAVSDIDEGIELLTGLPAGRRDDQGSFPDGSIHARVEARLERWANLEQTRPESPPAAS